MREGIETEVTPAASFPSAPLRVCLVNPPVTRTERYGTLASGGSSLPPLGLAWLGAVAESAGWEAVILDAEAEGLSAEQTAIRVLETGPALLGLTATTLSAGRAAEVASLVREGGYRGPVLLGGAHASAVPRQTLERWPLFDCLVIGEGERTFEELLSVVRETGGLPRGALGGIDGVAFRAEGNGEGEVVLTARRAFVEPLDNLPDPAWHLLPPLHRYYQPSALRRRSSPASSLVTTRGCSGRCTFCDRRVFGRRIRSFSAGRILSMVRKLRRGWGIRDVAFYDDNFLADKERLRRLAPLLAREAEEGLTWSCNARADVIDEEVADLIAEAGCWQVSIGVESGVQSILDACAKDVELSTIERAVEVLSRRGIRTKGFFIFGFPEDTEETVEQTIRFALSLPLDDFQVSFLTPFPGTALYHRLVGEGWRPPEWERMNMWQVVYSPPSIPAERLERLQVEAFRRFYLRPRVLWGHMVEALSSWERTKALLLGAIAVSRRWLEVMLRS